jgi:hypothetical protein
MEHLQTQVNKNGGTVQAPQAVIDALLTLTQAGLLKWKVTGSALTTLTGQPRFNLHGGDLILDHDADSAENMGAGFRMHVTRKQAVAIGMAAKQERVDFAKAQSLPTGSGIVPKGDEHGSNRQTNVGRTGRG